MTSHYNKTIRKTCEKKSCNKRVHSKNPSHTMCGDCHAKTYIKYCKSCDKKFRPKHSSHTLCPSCHAKTISKDCELCNKSFIPYEYSKTGQTRRLNPQLTRCNPCMNKKEKSCDFCNEKFWGSSYTDFCNACYTLKDCIKDNEDHDMIKKNFKIKVTYEIHSQSHSGYCSDPGEYEDKKSFKTYSYPVHNKFSNEDIDDDGTVLDIYSPKMHFYEKESETHANGYYGMKTTYTIESAKIVKNVREIDLDIEE